MSPNEADFNEPIPEAPSLVFGGESEEAAAGETTGAAAAAQAAPAQQTAATAEDVKKLDAASALTPKEIAQCDEFAKKIDLSDTNAILNYGAGTQKKLADFSQKTIDNVRTSDVGEVGDMLTDLVTQLKNFNVDEEEHGIAAFFKKKANKLEAIKARYSRVETNVETVQNELEKHQVTLMKDAAVLDRMYDLNLAYFKELSMYIVAGKKKLEEVRSKDLAEAQAKAAKSGLPEDAQAAKDLAAQCDRFEKKLYDLELTRTIAMQTAPQIRMVQSADTTMAEKIQSTIVNTIPLWKNQMVIAIGLQHSTEAAKAENEVNEMTNQLLRRNAENLKTATVESAKASEKGIVDIETLQHTNETLISAIDEVISIQKEGHDKRVAAEAQLAEIEDQLKAKLLEASKS